MVLRITALFALACSLPASPAWSQGQTPGAPGAPGQNPGQAIAPLQNQNPPVLPPYRDQVPTAAARQTTPGQNQDRPTAASRDEERPSLMPNRDIAVTYVDQSKQPRREKVYFSFGDGGRFMRIDDERKAAAYVLFDRKISRVIYVLRQEHAYIDMSDEVKDIPFFNARTIFERGSADVVSSDSSFSLPCTNWRWVAGHAEGTMCVTSDGIPLQFQPKGDSPLQAISVQNLSDALEPQFREHFFDIPAGYTAKPVPK